MKLNPLNAMSNLTVLKDVHQFKKVKSTKRTRFLATYRRQDFSFPKTIMYYLAKNPTTPKYYQKIIKTCKYFFVQNPIIILYGSLYDAFELKGWTNRGWEPCFEKQTISKFWITKKFRVRPKSDVDQNALTSIMPKIYRFDVKELRIHRQAILYKDFVNLVSSVKELYLYKVKVKDENDSDISIEKLLQTSAKVEKFSFIADTVLSYITSKTFGELLKRQNFLQLDFFALAYIPETFDIEAFYAFMKKNKQTFFRLYFDVSISEAYKNRIEEINDEILATENPEYRIPYIHFPGLDPEKRLKLLSSFS